MTGRALALQNVRSYINSSSKRPMKLGPGRCAASRGTQGQRLSWYSAGVGGTPAGAPCLRWRPTDRGWAPSRPQKPPLAPPGRYRSDAADICCCRRTAIYSVGLFFPEREPIIERRVALPRPPWEISGRLQWTVLWSVLTGYRSVPLVCPSVNHPQVLRRWNHIA